MSIETLLPPLSLLVLIAGCGAPEQQEVSATEAPEALTPRQYDRRGDEHLRAGRFEEAVSDFDRFLAAEPELAPHHWRRGIALYYAGRYAAGAAQFESHRGVNPADVENAAWHFLCVARERGVAAARAELLPVKPDSRPPMMVVYDLYAGRATPEDVLGSAARAGPTAQFYGHLYVALYHDVSGAREQARRHIRSAADSEASRGYMGDIARVHAAVIGA